jgi:hypothetical protein
VPPTTFITQRRDSFLASPFLVDEGRMGNFVRKSVFDRFICKKVVFQATPGVATPNRVPKFVSVCRENKFSFLQ